MKTADDHRRDLLAGAARPPMTSAANISPVPWSTWIAQCQAELAAWRRALKRESRSGRTQK
jgi:hypothetical protein